MKKYIKPECDVIELKSTCCLLAGSDISLSDNPSDVITDSSEELAPNFQSDMENLFN